ncbi:MAG: cytochrome b5-like heme/steroid binding domain-containing protein [Dermatophilus congolensis]|nr:cytochrome b5-like heme/steroid binding domain-containing protein [Dermatophilus congolensis]
MVSATSSGPFDLILGLPVHPLVVHAVVVLLPLGALMVIALFVVKRWRRPMAWPTLAVLAVAAGSAVLASQSGEALEERVGDPGAHAEWGERLVIVSIVLLVVAALWLVLAARQRQSSLASTVLGAVAVVMSIVALGLAGITGHSGSEAAWKDRIAPVASAGTQNSGEHESDDGGDSTTPASSPTTTAQAPAAAPAPTSTGTDTPYTMDQVAEHNTADSCWAAVDNGVYDVTEWITRHPGGPQRILNLCGTDATAAFRGQHATREAPNSRLDSFRIGTLAN